MRVCMTSAREYEDNNPIGQLGDEAQRIGLSARAHNLIIKG